MSDRYFSHLPRFLCTVAAPSSCHYESLPSYVSVSVVWFGPCLISLQFGSLNLWFGFSFGNVVYFGFVGIYSVLDHTVDDL